MMNDGFLRVAAATPKIKVADTVYNAAAVSDMLREAAAQQVKVAVFPELCLTGYTCQDLFLQSALLRGALAGLWTVAEASRGLDILAFVGLPFPWRGKLFNVAAAVQDGRVLGLVPKTWLPNYGEFYEARHFCPGNRDVVWVPEVEIRGGAYGVGGTKAGKGVGYVSSSQAGHSITREAWRYQPLCGGYASSSQAGHSITQDDVSAGCGETGILECGVPVGIGGMTNGSTVTAACGTGVTGCASTARGGGRTSSAPSGGGASGHDGDGVIPFGTDILFACEGFPLLTVAAELCEDVWVPSPPSIRHALAGASLIVNCSASDEMVGKDSYRQSLILGQSARLVSGYIYTNAGAGESTQDLVFSGHNIIAENGTMLAESPRMGSGMIVADMDMERIGAERRRMTTYPAWGGAGVGYPGEVGAERGYVTVPFALGAKAPAAAMGFRAATATGGGGQPALKRFIDPMPFVPADAATKSKRCEEILMIQSMGLAKRLEHTGIRHSVLGISGGLDSTLALLVTVKASDRLGIGRENVHAVTMPCFGTTDRTYDNACKLSRKLGVTLHEVDIKEAVTLHFRDIGQDAANHDVTYENSQARERTQVLMDLANKLNGLVVGTGDMSELALGWATYNGDHMSMYGVNVSVPKTLVRHLVRHFADTCGEAELSATLTDVLETPVSPELLPPEGGVISQKTEDLVGPYELHDFFLYYVLRFGFSPSKVFRLAGAAWGEQYDGATILKWLKVFYRRFFSQQFKRSCLPDGPKVGSVALSPRGDLRMPSDASAALWLEELERIHDNLNGE
ncbi:MAG: NAD(+) synthase [Lachnospiraceae bacterium]|jgi:NAD+ synthase (glutamine-hydrolysing)|nr:NAD(+) synthase [Lachnospiraceae bacterium]